METYSDVLRYRELLGNLFRRDLQAKYRGSALGVLWTIANPVMLMGVYLLVFGVVWNSNFSTVGHYPLFLLSGLALWTFFGAALQSLWCWRLQKGDKVSISEITDAFVKTDPKTVARPNKKNVEMYRKLQELQDRAHEDMREMFARHRAIVS